MKPRGFGIVLVLLAMTLGAALASSPPPAFAGETITATATFLAYNQPCEAEGGCSEMGTLPAADYTVTRDPAYPGWVHIQRSVNQPWAVEAQMTAAPAVEEDANADSPHGTETLNGLGSSVSFRSGGTDWTVRLNSWDGLAPKVSVSSGSIWWDYRTYDGHPDHSYIKAFTPPWGGGLSCNWYRYESVDHYNCSVIH